MTVAAPDFYNDLDTAFAHAWSLWVRGGAERRSPYHTPVVTSVDQHGAPQARIMVLRQAIPANRTLRFHTDTRSAKVAEIGSKTAIAVLGYDPASKIQLRVRGTSEILREGDLVEDAWARTSLSSRKCYIAAAGPGAQSLDATSGLPAELASRDPTLAESLPGRANFSLLMVTIDSLEWVYLAASGHRRARFDWTGRNWSKEWLVP
jgi:pyridoxamine 5'-phosphate oxidase